MHNTNIPCGCLIEYEGDNFHQDYSINWCPLHSAAQELLEESGKLMTELGKICLGLPEPFDKLVWDAVKPLHLVCVKAAKATEENHGQ